VIEKAKFRYSAQDGVLELEGSEEFVSKHFESLTDIVRVMARHLIVEQKSEPVVTTSDHPSSSDAELTSESASSESIASYPNVYSEINGKLKIVVDIPGSTKQLQMKNAALLYCYGAKLLGDEQVASKVIRDTCEEHGCIDSANFSKIFDDKTVFLSDGVKGGAKQIKLTFQGLKKARELLQSA
jgi:hypothetical protein